MKKVLLILGIIILGLLICLLLIVNNNMHDMEKLKNKLGAKTNLTNINYVNSYDDYYLVKDDNNLYVFSNEFKELLKIDNILIHENTNNYDIIYKDGTVLYLNDYLKKGKLYYEYYDLYDYKLVNKIVIGG